MRFTWNGIGTGTCYDGGCGVCFGICVVIAWQLWDGSAISNTEKSQGIDGAGIKFVNGKIRIRSAGRTMDNGDGKCRISQDYILPQSISQAMGISSQQIKVLAGTYTVSIDASGLPYVLLNYVLI